MTDKIVSLRGGPAPTGEGTPTENSPWHAAVVTALADGAVYGVLIYFTNQGQIAISAIEGDRITVRGLIEEVRDAIRSE